MVAFPGALARPRGRVQPGHAQQSVRCSRVCGKVCPPVSSSSMRRSSRSSATSPLRPCGRGLLPRGQPGRWRPVDPGPAQASKRIICAQGGHMLTLRLVPRTGATPVACGAAQPRCLWEAGPAAPRRAPDPARAT